MKRAKETVIIFNPELEKAFKGFVPRFANDDDLRIVKQMGKVRKMLSEVDNERFREAEKRKKDKMLTSKMKEIQRLEKEIIGALQRRFEALINDL